MAACAAPMPRRGMGPAQAAMGVQTLEVYLSCMNSWHAELFGPSFQFKLLGQTQLGRETPSLSRLCGPCSFRPSDRMCPTTLLLLRKLPCPRAQQDGLAPHELRSALCLTTAGERSSASVLEHLPQGLTNPTAIQVVLSPGHRRPSSFLSDIH